MEKTERIAPADNAAHPQLMIRVDRVPPKDFKPKPNTLYVFLHLVQGDSSTSIGLPQPQARELAALLQEEALLARLAAVFESTSAAPSSTLEPRAPSS